MKKENLANLVNSLVSPDEGTEPQERESLEQGALSQKRDLTAKEIEDFGIDPELQEAVNTLRRRKVGRPKGRRNGDPKQREARATFIVEPLTLRKFKYIALAETRLYKDVVQEALAQYVAEWEGQNGEIKLPKKRNL